MDDETRRHLRREWIECLFEFASPKLQQVWVTGEEAIVATFTECMCSYFDDLNLNAGLETAVHEGWLSVDEVGAIAAFHRVASEYKPPHGGDAAVLRDRDWAEVVDAAQKAWVVLTRLITDHSERELMEDLQNRWGGISEGPS